jgi:hypothetical protein
VVVGVDSLEPFSRARAIQDGVAQLDTYQPDVLLFNDADSLVLTERIREAVELAVAAPGIVFAFTCYVRLNEDGSVDVRFEYAGSQGVAAIRWECYQQAGGYDPKFEAWGYEDLAFGLVCEALWPVRRVQGNLYHLWHPPRDNRAEDADRIAANLALYERYCAAAGDVEALLAIREEAAWLRA